MNLITNTNKISLNPQDLQIMGILNVTPDSFSDGGKFSQIDNAIRQVETMIEQGAVIIDVGGESTRPGAANVTVKDELARTIPIIKAIKSRFDVMISIDTSKAEVMNAAIEHGVNLINDVRALQGPNCLSVVGQSDLPVCLMHMQGQPRTMQTNPQYKDLLSDIAQFFQQRINACEQVGISKERIILDPGYGFGKTVQQG